MKQTPWMRLQALSCAHAAALYAAGKRGKQISVPEDIQDNVFILGRGNDEELKARVLWYVTIHPAIFQACSAEWNKSRTAEVK